MVNKASKARNTIVHIIGEDDKLLCGQLGSIRPENRKTLKTFPQSGRLCKYCSKNNTPTILMPAVGGVKAEGQILRNRPVPSSLIDPDEVVTGSTSLTPKGSKLLMLRLNPCGVTWYYASDDELAQDLKKIKSINLK